jgi:hypothetical protein
LVQAFLKKWWVESDFKAPNLPLHYGSKLPAVTITVFITIQVVKNKNIKDIFLSMCDVKVFLTFTSLNLVLL